MRAVILSGGFSVLQRPVFIITGIIVARGLSVKRESKSLEAGKSQMLIVGTKLQVRFRIDSQLIMSFSPISF